MKPPNIITILLLIPFLGFGQYKKVKDRILVKMDFIVVDSIKLKNDIVYKCKDSTRIRISKDSVYIMGKRQYLKVKR